MFLISEIRSLHIELSSICNARCPLCPRNLYGYPYNLGYKETNFSFDLIKKSFNPSFVKQLTHILINGNFGDFISNPESLEIVRYFRQSNDKMKIRISTNGSARNEDFWHDLAAIGNIEVRFCLDGLEDTHHLYRQDTNWKKILDNAKIFIAAGGVAVWKMIKFDHNLHQIELCRNLSKELGFAEFLLIDHGRDNGPVFDRKGNLSHVIGKWDGTTNINELLKLEVNSNDTLGLFDNRKKILCKAKQQNSIYISAEGKVYPCCWMGFSPETYKNKHFSKLNEQLKSVIKNNSLHDSNLETCIQWFTNVEESWNKKTFQLGLIKICSNMCSKS